MWGHSLFLDPAWWEEKARLPVGVASLHREQAWVPREKVHSLGSAASEEDWRGKRGFGLPGTLERAEGLDFNHEQVGGRMG